MIANIIYIYNIIYICNFIYIYTHNLSELFTVIPSHPILPCPTKHQWLRNVIKPFWVQGKPLCLLRAWQRKCARLTWTSRQLTFGTKSIPILKELLPDILSISGGFHTCGYPNRWMAYNGKSIWTWHCWDSCSSNQTIRRGLLENIPFMDDFLS